MNIKPAEVDARFASAAYAEQLFSPEPPLDLIINSFYCFKSLEPSETVIKHLSPNLEVMMVFSFGTPIRISFGNEPFTDQTIDKTAIIGPLKKMLNYEVPQGADVIVVNFRLNGFNRLFNLPVSALEVQAVIDPDTLLGKIVFRKLWNNLFVLQDSEARIKEMILQAIPFIKSNSDQMEAFLKGERYFYDPKINPAKAMASEMRLTERMIQMRFKEHVGYSAKELIRFLRFKQVVLNLIAQESDTLDVFEIIATQGYHDQSHLIKDFNHYLGTTPKKFFKSIKDKSVCTTKDAGDQSIG
jgi:AraC-like DNA-binding protein